MRSRVYVNDIFVCEDEQLYTGLNIRGDVEVGRDWNRVGLRSEQIAHVWSNACRDERAAQLLFKLLTLTDPRASKCYEVLAHHDHVACAAVLRVFQQKHGANAYPILTRDTEGFKLISRLGMFQPVVCSFRLFACLSAYSHTFNPQTTANHLFGSLLQNPEYAFPTKEEAHLWQTVLDMVTSLLDIPPSRLAVRKTPDGAPLTAIFHTQSRMYVISHQMLDARRVHELFKVTQDQCGAGPCTCVLSCMLDKLQEESKGDTSLTRNGDAANATAECVAGPDREGRVAIHRGGRAKESGGGYGDTAADGEQYHW
jgi:hypothetical protein